MFNLERNLLRRAVSFLMEPLDLQLGFRELDFFRELADNYTDFQRSLAAPTESVLS